MCSICINDPPINAIRLECGHRFCFLCIKSWLETQASCAICRVEVGIEFNFQEHQVDGPIRIPSGSLEGHHWFYEGFRGWWLYDPDTSHALEDAHQSGSQQIERFLAGANYIMDLTLMCQRTREEGGRIRKICRAKLHEVPNIIGMSGIKGADFAEALEMMKAAGPIGTYQNIVSRRN